MKDENKASFFQWHRRCCSSTEFRFVVHFRDEFVSFLCCGTSRFKNSFSFFNQCSRNFSGILDDQRPISLSPVIASDNSSMAFLYGTSWRSSAAAPLLRRGLLSSLRWSKSVLVNDRGTEFSQGRGPGRGLNFAFELWGLNFAPAGAGVRGSQTYFLV